MGMQKYDWCPTQTYFTETTPATAFFSQVGAMYLEGNWNLPQLMENYPEMRGKWDIAKLPKCPDPLSGDGRATMSNGLCYSTVDYAVQAVYNSASPKWKSQVLDQLTKVYSGDQDLMTGLENMQTIVDTETAKKLADN